MKTGERFILTAGEYSDFGTVAVIVADRDFSFDLALARWLMEFGDGDEGCGIEGKLFGYDEADDTDAFIKWLASEGLARADAGTRVVHVADYRRPILGCAGDADSELLRIATAE